MYTDESLANLRSFPTRRSSDLIHQYAIASELHRDRGVGSGAYAGVHDHRRLGVLDDDLQVPGIENAHARADQRSKRHYGRSEERRVGKECRYRWSPYH